jgi:hypothetical protein
MLIANIMFVMHRVEDGQPAGRLSQTKLKIGKQFFYC